MIQFKTWLRDLLEADTRGVVQSMARPAATQPPVQPTWIKSKALQAAFGMKQNQEVAVAKLATGDWMFQALDGSKAKGTIPAASIATAVQSYRDESGQPIKSNSLATLMPAPQTKPQPQQPQQPQQNPQDHILGNEKLSEEQKSIDAEFERMMQGKQSHMVIEALAGTGKTTMLKHLAWKYGKTGQKWLYLVFNTKNRVEAAEKFPQWVTVATTNSFLGGELVLGSKDNKRRIAATERIVGINKNHRDDPNEKKIKLEKARLVADGGEFTEYMARIGIPSKSAAEGYDFDMRDPSVARSTLGKLLTSINLEFKEQVLKLLGLAKSFSIDPRQENLEQKLITVFDKYDFDTSFDDIKDRIKGYSGSFGAIIASALEDLMGYDFMSKDYKNEIIKGAEWMMNATMPHATQQTYQRDKTKYNLGQFRDFNDDLWFAAVHADQIKWPKFDIVLADEVQDFNEAQKIVLAHLAKAGAKIVAVGDKNQSIYRFRGADASAFGNISNQLKDLSNDKDWKTHSLTTNYRSRQEVLDFVNQNTHVKNLRAGKRFESVDGKVSRGNVAYDDTFSTLRNEKQQGGMKETAFIARTNQPLVQAGLRLLSEGIPFVIIGRDISKELMQHINRVIGKSRLSDHDNVQILQERLDAMHEDEKDRHGDQSAKKAYLQELGDTTEAISNAIGTFMAISQNRQQQQPQQYGRYRQPQQGGSIADFKKWLISNLSGFDIDDDERDLDAYKKKMEGHPVILTTAHKSKGLEFDRVYILRDDQFPHAKAKRDEDLEQEANARYVAYTRAKDELHVLKIKGQPGVKEE